MKDNKGFSLIEIIIVIALLGVVVTIGVRNIDVVFGYSAREANTNLKSAIESLKVASLSKSKGTAKSVYISDGSLNPDLDCYLKVYKKKNGVYYATSYEKVFEYGVERERTIDKELAERRIKIEYSYTSDPLSRYEVGEESAALIIAYNRSTGGFLVQEEVVSGTTEKQVGYIYCSSGNREYCIRLMPTTGKVVTE